MKTLLLIGLGLLVSMAALTQDAPERPGHRVVSFNVRYGSADDGPDRWELRRTKVVQTIRDLEPDVLGLQEVEAFQVRELLAACPRYAAAGVHRDDGRLAGEAATVLYDRARYSLAGTGTFWLSDTPEVAGSNTWGAACNRVCTWVRLVDLERGEAYWVFNAHFDHRSQEAREKSAALILERVAERGGADPFVVMGDLNADEQNPAFLRLLRGTEGMALADTYREHHPEGAAGTFTSFRVDSDGGARKIDHVLVGPGWRVDGAGIDRRKVDGRYPSDHFPVWADLRLDAR